MVTWKKLVIGIALAFLALSLMGTQASGITVISQSPNTEIVLGLPVSELEFENPLAGTETTYGYKILDWRDADYSSGPPPWYDDWTVSHPGAIDGIATEIWMRANGHSIWTSTLVPSKIVSIHLPGDSNDGLAQVMVDGNEVARLDMNTQGTPDRALIIVKALSNTTHNVQVNDLGAGPSGLGIDVHCFGAAALTREFDIKWNQPPQPAHPNNVYYGWNERSVYETGPIVADDWVCTTNEPVTKIRWWGSYIGWQDSIPPPAIYLPNRYVMTIWTDVPVGIEPFSHPGTVLWRYDVNTLPTAEFVGFDYDPQTQSFESCFLYSLDLEPEKYFCQTGTNNIYWISIAAVYDNPVSEIYKWGWKARPRDPASAAPDDAVRIFNPLLPNVGQIYLIGEPIWWPTPLESWDMAFELISSQKWAQPPDLLPTGIDVNCTRQTTPPMQFLLADDWECRATGSVTQISVWCSWYQDQYPTGGPGSVRFYLSIHSNVPAMPPNPSMPGTTLWTGTFNPGQFQFQNVSTSLVEGWMNPPDQYTPVGDHNCWRYTFTLPPGTFVQQGTPTSPTIYWLDVQAQPMTTNRLIGWKTAWCHWMDDATWVSAIEPYFGLWNALRYPPGHPMAGQTIDLAFMINGEPATQSIKWSQPPQPYTPPDGFNGWNERSEYGGQQIAADDWVCTTTDPVTDIHWWGSFIGWNWRELPYSSLPSRFHLAIWTDVPAGAIDPFSHPGQVIWETYCENYSIEFAGWDFDPRLPARDPNQAPEACFKFECYLPANEWFYQDSGQNIYWLSIAPQYDLIPPQFPWGWKTTPRLDSQSPDDGVAIYDPTAPTVGIYYLSGSPLEYPAGVSWDLAFMLTSQHVVVPQPKWAQPPHPPNDGFDAASDLWWAGNTPPGSKWHQLPDVNLPALHAHDWAPNNRLVLANDWICEGGVVTDLHWWGTTEPSAGQLAKFRLSIHTSTPDPPCLPIEPAVWTQDVPIAQISVTDTGLNNVGGERIYLYGYNLPTAFVQTPGERYWMNVSAISANIQNPVLWKWQEATAPVLCQAAQKTEPPVPGTWQPMPVANVELAFRITSTQPAEPLNKVVADDFVSDGRPINMVRWWGSYFDDRYAPGAATDPVHVLDGWLISFHWTDDGTFNRTCPPDSLFDPPPTVLGVYFAPASAVIIEPQLNHYDCFNKLVYKYSIDLSQCCLICSEADPRSGTIPAQPTVFAEEARLRYWLDIQAVTGAMWIPIGPSVCELFLTPHLPPENGGHFWGWHTSPGPDTSLNLCGALHTACTGKITDMSMYPPNCWQYGQWIKQSWDCPNAPPPDGVQMAFELITRTAATPLAPWIVTDPVSVTTCVGYKATFTVDACGTAPLSYQWRHNGSNVGGNSDTLVINPVTAGDAGNYDVVVTNGAGNVTSAIATLTVYSSGTGDVDGNGLVDSRDIQPWIREVLAWSVSAVPTPATCESDMDVDGDVDLVDLPLFVSALLTAP